MKAVFAVRALGAICALVAIGGMAAPARAEMSVETARASVAPFYKALNAEFAKDSPDLVRQATAPEWVSCRGNDACNSRDEVIAGIAARLASIPDLKWQIKDVLVSGDQVIVRGDATGNAGGRIHRRATQRKIFQADVDRRAHTGRRQYDPLLPHRGLDRRGAQLTAK